MRSLLFSFVILASGLFAQDFSNKTLVYPFYPRETGKAFDNVTTEEVCVTGYTKKVRKVSTSLKHRVFKKYGVTKGHYREYEVDHIISLVLGGSNSIDNLFPQPYEVYLNVNGKDMRMGAREKDVVENNLHHKVCRGEITLKQAQEIVSTNWISYYLKLKKKI